ncbi:hypothetical protein NQ854_24920 [Rhodococcus ruber]|uniref:LGFP repeat-containing protein n=1 Tax=Rhodococcus ruber TaxID=1830 RepID=UPI001EE486C0|nr:hypothetical protein [Rhodococcus ruber]
MPPLPAELRPAPPAADQPVPPDDPARSSKTAEPDPDWHPTENPKSTRVPGQMRSDREEVPAPFTKEDADKAEIAEARLRSSRSLTASSCQVYWPSWFQVCGAIRDKYNALGGPASFLSYPTSGNIINPGGTGERVTFANGPIYWSAATGAHPVVNSFLNRWGIHGYEAGWLGYPTTDEIVHADAVGRHQEFQNGAIYVAFQNAIGSAIRNGPLRDKWNSVGAETPGSLLGYPIQDQIGLPDGQGQMDRFERGVIYWHPSVGAWEVYGSIESIWAADGYEAGKWGYPTGAPYDEGQYSKQPFQNGIISFSLLTEAKETIQGCTFNQQWPHHSHHEDLTVSGIASVTCDSDRVKIEAHVTMWWYPDCEGVFGCGSVIGKEEFSYSKGDGQTANVRSLETIPRRGVRNSRDAVSKR